MRRPAAVPGSERFQGTAGNRAGTLDADRFPAVPGSSQEPRFPVPSPFRGEPETEPKRLPISREPRVRPSDGERDFRASRGCPPTRAGQAVHALMAHWPERRRGDAFSASDLMALARTDAEWRAVMTAWCPPQNGELLPSAKSIGCALRAIRGKEVGGWVLDIVKRTGSGALWGRFEARPAPTPQASPAPPARPASPTRSA